MNGNGRFNQRSLFWKEWRSRRWTLAALIALVLLSPFLVSGMGWALTSQAAPILGGKEAATVMLCAFWIGVGVLGSTLLTREEHDPARGFLYTLPVSRREILAVKLGVLALQTLLLAAVSLATMSIWIRGPWTNDALGFILASLLFCVPGAAVAAILGLHFRSPVVALLVSAIVGLLLFLILFNDPIIAADAARPFGPGVRATANCALAAAALLGWLFFLFCRTAVQELNPTARASLGLLFAVAALEVFATALLCNWRDLAFLVFGV